MFGSWEMDDTRSIILPFDAAHNLVYDGPYTDAVVGSFTTKLLPC